MYATFRPASIRPRSASAISTTAEYATCAPAVGYTLATIVGALWPSIALIAYLVVPVPFVTELFYRLLSSDLIDPSKRNSTFDAMGVNPRGADLKRFLDQGPEGEVVMINLLRFAKGGREQYEAYAYAIEPFLLKVGGEITYAGHRGRCARRRGRPGVGCDRDREVSEPRRVQPDGRGSGLPGDHAPPDLGVARDGVAADHAVAALGVLI